MGHDVDGAGDEPALTAAAVEALAETLQALGSPSRLRILLRLRESACAVGDLAVDVGMEQSAVSHQLRVLRHLGLVVGVRDGRSVRYRLHDAHVAQLLDEAAYHVEHLRSGIADGEERPVGQATDPDAHHSSVLRRRPSPRTTNSS